MKRILITVLVGASFFGGYCFRSINSQDANALFEDGFTILDSDGDEVEAFDWSIHHLWEIHGYWTKEPKE